MSCALFWNRLDQLESKGIVGTELTHCAARQIRRHSRARIEKAGPREIRIGIWRTRRSIPQRVQVCQYLTEYSNGFPQDRQERRRKGNARGILRLRGGSSARTRTGGKKSRLLAQNDDSAVGGAESAVGEKRAEACKLRPYEDEGYRG